MDFPADPTGPEDDGGLRLSSSTLKSLRAAGFYFVDYARGQRFSSGAFSDPDDPSPAPVRPDFDSLIHPDDIAAFRSLWSRVRAGKEDAFNAEFRVRVQDGDWRWIHTAGAVLNRGPDGGVESFAGMDTDITRRKEAELVLTHRLEEQEQRYELSETLRSAGMAVSESSDPKGSIAMLFRQSRRFIDFDLAVLSILSDGAVAELVRFPQEATSVPDRSPELAVRELIGELSPRIADDIVEGGPYRSWLGVPIILRRELLGIMEFWSGIPGAFRSETVWPAIAFADTFAVALANHRRISCLQEEARTDSLTGLLTKGYFYGQARETLKILARDGRPASVIVADLDLFKAVNDRYGHIAGDQVIKAVAALCLQILRKEDLVCRFGGEEFIALLPGVGLREALVIAERIRASLERSSVDEVDSTITASFGVAESCPGSSADIEDLIKAADAAMYRAKRGGRNQVAAARPDGASI